MGRSSCPPQVNAGPAQSSGLKISAIKVRALNAHTNVSRAIIYLRRVTMSALSKETASMLRALAEPRRVAILKIIRKRELRAGQIAENFRTTRPAISQHLRVLTEAGLLSERRKGTSRLYRLRLEGFAQLRSLLDDFWEDALARLKKEVEEQARKSRKA